MPAPESTNLNPASRTRRRIIQIALAALALALFTWAAILAKQQLDTVNETTGQTGWQDLRNAGLPRVALLLALSATSVLMNGLMWWLAIRPVRQLPLGRTIGANAIATLLSFIPMKPSVIFRALFHKRADNLPILQLGGWAVAMGALLIAGLAPPVALALILPATQAELWWILAPTTVIASAIAGTFISRFLATGPGWRAFEQLTTRLFKQSGQRAINSDAFKNLHSGIFMLARFPTTVGGSALRFIDGLNYGARFYIAASILGLDLGFAQGVVFGMTFFLIGVFSPIGAFGIRELITGFVLSKLTAADNGFAVTVFVQAIEMIAVLALAAIAAACMHKSIRQALSPTQKPTPKPEPEHPQTPENHPNQPSEHPTD